MRETQDLDVRNTYLWRDLCKDPLPDSLIKEIYRFGRFGSSKFPVSFFPFLRLLDLGSIFYSTSQYVLSGINGPFLAI
jgi:hypothetical protein